jgi:hypothetical protein
MSIQAGDTVTIKRGKRSGDEGEVKLTNADTVVLEMKDGELITQKRTNIKAPDEATITQGELAQVVASHNTIQDLVHALDSRYPGFANRVGRIDWGQDARQSGEDLPA